MYCVYCSETSTYGLVKNPATGVQKKCLVCTSGNTSCCHIFKYRVEKDEPKSNNEKVQEFNCKSSEKISYPFEGDDITKFAYHASGNPYPTKLIPKFDSSKTCIHKNVFDSDDPVKSGWVMTNKAKIYMAFISIICVVFYRPTKG